MQRSNGIDELDLDDDDHIDDQPTAILAPPHVANHVHAPTATNNRNDGVSIHDVPLNLPPRHIEHKDDMQEFRIPGPAGNPNTGRYSAGNAFSNVLSDQPMVQFNTIEWQQGLQLLNLTQFDVDHLTRQHSTVQAATQLKQSGNIPRLLVRVATIHPTHSNESFIRIEDPTGSMGGTLVSTVLDVCPQLTRGSVLLLENITIVKTPSPHSVHHACILPETIKRVIPRQRRAAPIVSPQEENEQRHILAQPLRALDTADSRPVADVNNTIENNLNKIVEGIKDTADDLCIDDD